MLSDADIQRFKEICARGYTINPECVFEIITELEALRKHIIVLTEVVEDQNEIQPRNV